MDPCMGVGRAPFKRSAPRTARGLRIGRRELGVCGSLNRSGASGGGRCRRGLLQCSSCWRLGRPGRGAGRRRPRGLLIAGAHSADMAGWWPALSRAARRHPWPTDVLLYGSLVSAGDALQQRLQGREDNWRQTRRVATLVVTFHANFNYVWLGLLERALPGRAPHAVLAKLLCDQVVGAPIAVSAFYVGMSILQGKDDIFLDLKQKFWNTYLTEPHAVSQAGVQWHDLSSL
ncbi:mpv17-like protein isoform X3 [Pan paniscus]|uniref:mpv17-like protein isoform X3 n=1 Tax=Pan paniscus TaxID=9597 RepID=UPI00243719A3|nr:mpv17-like protein isoform X3 [Pan paniscus]XP_054970987.1 mpv17-like protein isoform X3 [Pan paniscus]